MATELRSVEDGEELIGYLHRRDKYAKPDSSPHPDLILLDLKMPGNALLKVLLVEDDYILTHDLLSEMERFELEWLTDYDDALKGLGLLRIRGHFSLRHRNLLHCSCLVVDGARIAQ